MRGCVRARPSTPIVLSLLLGACASTKTVPQTPVDLTEARSAVDTARAAGAAEKAPQAFAQAVDRLRQAEAQLTQGDKDSATKAEWLGKLAVQGAQCALAQSQAAPVVVAPPPPKPVPVSGELRSRLEAAQLAQKHLEEQVAELQREKDILSREILRTKARLEGAATMEEASSAIAEARILVKRIPPDRSSQLARCSDLITKAEKELRHESFGAALFYALDAQEAASGGGGAAGSTTETALTKKSYTVKATANLRKGPALDAPVAATLAAGTLVEALLAQGDWIKVRAGNDTGWVNRALLE
jgi:hypothetical protein